MTKKLLFSILFVAVAIVANAQTKKDATTATPTSGGSRGAAADPFEIGVGAGLYIFQGDLEYKPSFGLSVHARKSLDAIFSIRGEGFYGLLLGKVPSTDAGYPYGGPNTKNGEGEFSDAKGRFFNTSKTTMITGEGQLVINLTSVRFDGKKRRFTPYVFVGGGGGYANTLVDVIATAATAATATRPAYQANAAQKGAELEINGRLTTKYIGLASGGAGVAVKMTDKIFLGLEGKASILFGKRADLIDGYNYGARDIPVFLSARLNYIIGNGLPAFYASPFDQIQSDIAELKARPKFDPTDTDMDGVIDMFDQEKATPAGYTVDTRGVTLDSDADGYPNSKDKEPYSAPGFKVNGDGIAQMPKPNYTTEADVNRIIDAKLADLKATLKPQAIVDWFLPMINFDFNKSNIKSSEFEKLAYVANVMQRNSGVRVAVSGYTDATSSQGYNDNLSYNRSEAAINYLTTKYGIARDRFVLDYNGENTMIVDTQAKNYINRRVEFRVAQAGDVEKGRPSGNTAPSEVAPTKKAPKFKGTKEAGY
jgi:OmpA-OmpF porin, OOP family